MSEPSYNLVLPCAACREHWTVSYTRADFPEENIWLCPKCAEPNRVRLKGRLLKAEPYRPGK